MNTRPLEWPAIPEGPPHGSLCNLGRLFFMLIEARIITVTGIVGGRAAAGCEQGGCGDRECCVD